MRSILRNLFDFSQTIGCENKNSIFKDRLNRPGTIINPQNTRQKKKIHQKSALQVPCASSYGNFTVKNCDHRILVPMSYISLWELHKLQTQSPSGGNKSMKIAYKPIQGPKICFFKIGLNRLLTLPDYSTGLQLLISSGIIDFENKNRSVVTKH